MTFLDLLNYIIMYTGLTTQLAIYITNMYDKYLKKKNFLLGII